MAEIDKIYNSQRVAQKDPGFSLRVGAGAGGKQSD